MNQCSRDDVCNKFEMCVPSEEESTGLMCVCPPGLKGERCSEATCQKPVECSQKEPISLLGNGYFQLHISQPVEQRMDLHMEFKTASRNAVLLHGAGLRDYHYLQVMDGELEYVWNCGSGDGKVHLSQKKVDDGRWHQVRVVRRRQHVQLTLDDSVQASSTSPGSNDVLNLFSNAMILNFGAKVESEKITDDFFQGVMINRISASELKLQISNGTVGCIGRVGLDGVDLPKSEQGLRMFNAKLGCDALVLGPCLNAPCLNSGQCIPRKESNSYSCICPQRFTGVNCEIDLNACASSPCPNGIKCHNLYNDFHCLCPSGFTGKTCQMHGDWDPCITKPCGPYGQCSRHKSTFVCRCSDGFSGNFCSEKVPRMLPDSLLPGTPHFYILSIVVGMAFLLALVIVIVCRRQNGNRLKEKTSNSDRLPSDNPANPLIQVTPSLAPPVYRNSVDRAPPRPPRQRGQVGLPTVEVRPMQSINKGNDVSMKRNVYDTAADLEDKPQPPPHRSQTKSGHKPKQFEEEGSDYLTMKPVKRSPPTPPAHGTSPDMVKLYDNPNDGSDT